MNDPIFFLVRNDSKKPILNEIEENQKLEIIRLLGGGNNIKINLSGKKGRAVRIQNNTYNVLGLAFDEDQVKSKKILFTEAATLLSVADDFERRVMLAAQKEAAHTKRLIHNLKSLTAKTMQEIFYVARQDTMLQQGKRAKHYVKNEIIKNPDDAAAAFISILKHQAAQNAEFSAFNKLNGDVGQLKKKAILFTRF